MSRSALIISLASVLLAGCAKGALGDGTRDGGLEIIDAGSGDPDAPPGCVEMTIDLLANGDFEAGPTGWAEITNGGLGLVREEGAGLPFDAEAGAWAAIIGGFNSAAIEMTQTVTIPADATPSRFVGSGCWVTEEAAGTMFDFLTLEVRAAGAGATIATLLDISNSDADATCDWTPFEVDLAMVGSGADVEVHFASTTDGASVTTFAFDSLALEAIQCE